tara:strand:- start:3647 stop:4441 length:795 start_codon:yes stop_codon:yes gene_type:complete
MDNKIIHTKINNDKTKDIEKWVLDQKISKDLTTHWFVEELPENIYNTIHHIIKDLNIYSTFFANLGILYNINPIYEMNELYVSTNNDSKNNSDKVFFKKHIDGPFGFFPLCGVYRVLVSCNDNNFITTHFPLRNKDYCISRNSVLGFDYNREIHYITLNNDKKFNKEDQRIVLKLHYVVYPIGFKFLAIILSYLCTTYNTIARKAFINTLEPKSYKQKILNNFIQFTTDNWIITEKYIRFRNISYLFTGIIFYNLLNGCIWVLS